jgi:dTDP-4-amino-4,6-dideoxygalactose transaminase
MGFLAPDAETRHDSHLYTLMIDLLKCGITRDGFLKELQARKIGVGVHYLSIPERNSRRETAAFI